MSETGSTAPHLLDFQVGLAEHPVAPAGFVLDNGTCDCVENSVPDMMFHVARA